MSYLIHAHILTSLHGKIRSNAWFLVEICVTIPGRKGFLLTWSFQKFQQKSDPQSTQKVPTLQPSVPPMLSHSSLLSWKDSMLLDEDFTSVDADLIFAKVKGRCHGRGWQVGSGKVWEVNGGREAMCVKTLPGIWIYCEINPRKTRYFNLHN